MVYITDPLQALLGSLSEFDSIPYGIYRIAMKLRYVQKKTKLCHVSVAMWREVVEEHCLENPNLVLQPAEISGVVTSLLRAVSREADVPISEDESARLMLSWLSILYPQPALTSLQLNVPVILLCNSDTTTKHRMLFEMARVSGYELSLQELSHLLHLSSYLLMSCGEQATVGSTTSLNVAQSCYTHSSISFHRGITLEQYESWILSDPDYVAWIPTLHRLNISQHMQHEAKCGICRCYPILGLRYRCLRCISLDLCQECFLKGKVYKNHDETHPLKEYITQGSTAESIKDLSTVVKTYFKQKGGIRSNRSVGRARSTTSFIDSQDQYTVNTEEWCGKKGRLPSQLPLQQHTSCPDLPATDMGHFLLNNHSEKRVEKSEKRLDELELQNNRLAAEVHRLKSEVAMNSPPPYHSQETDSRTLPSHQGSYYEDSAAAQPLQTIAEIADAFASDMGIYCGSGGERHPVISQAGHICVAMEGFLGDMFSKTPWLFSAPPKPKRTSPNISKSSSPPSSRGTPPPAPVTGINLQLSYDTKYRSIPGHIVPAPKVSKFTISPLQSKDTSLPNSSPSGKFQSSTPKSSRKPLDISFTCCESSISEDLGRSKGRRNERRNYLTSKSEVIPRRQEVSSKSDPRSAAPLLLTIPSEVSRSRISRNYRGSPELSLYADGSYSELTTTPTPTTLLSRSVV